MDIAALILGLLAIADLACIVHLRRRRAERLRNERVMRSLELAVQRENFVQQPAPARRWPPVRRAV